MKKFLVSILIGIMTMFSLFGCTQMDVVKHNIQMEANYFNVARRIVVVNARTDKPLFELKGYFAVDNNEDNELVITCEIGKDKYQVHYVYLNEWTLYVIEDLSGTEVSKYHYEIWYMPETIIPSIKPKD
jgi:hypothetical protein